MDEYIANIIAERQKMRFNADCSDYGLAIMKGQPDYRNRVMEYWSSDDIIQCNHINVDPQTISEEKHMNQPTIIDLIGKYMRKAHCKKGEAIRRISEMFDYSEHHIARDVSREKAINNGTLKAPINTLHDYWLDFYNDLDKMSVEKAEKRVLIARFNQRFTRISTNRFRIKDVIFNNPATIIFWEDGTKTVAKCKEGETYSPEIGIMVCYFKRLISAPFTFPESPNKALSLLSEIATYNTKGGK